LNRSAWQKGMIVIVISICEFSTVTWSFWRLPANTCVLFPVATIGLSLVSGFGGIMNFYSAQYFAEGKTQEDLTHLTSYPGLTM
jgi:ABC-type branched-subunit amino acid transport system permease subunit